MYDQLGGRLVLEHVGGHVKDLVKYHAALTLEEESAWEVRGYIDDKG